MRLRAAFAALLWSTACASSRIPSGSVQLVHQPGDVSGCERIDPVRIANPYGSALPDPTATPVGMDPETQAARYRSWIEGPAPEEALRHWAAQKGGDTVLVTRFEIEGVEGVAYRCTKDAKRPAISVGSGPKAERSP